ncbi:ribonuclease E inhibitor RraB [bacterium]|nr:ribonuclease E inhibitor RraB [bacterium]
MDNRDIKPTNLFSGAQVLHQLKRWGSHLDEKHEITFWLYFPSQNFAHQAGQRAEAAGLHVDITESMHGQWLCLITCTHIPDEMLMDGVFKFCDELVSSFQGQFDGWESPLMTTPEEINELLSRA